MPIAEVEFPDGRIGEFEVPEGTTPEQVISFVQQNLNQFTQRQEPQVVQQQATQTPTQTQPQARQAQLQQFRDETTRDLGLGARAALEGVAFLPSLIPDLAALGINAASGSNIPLLSDIVSEGLTAIGLPEPETGGERVFGDIAEGAIGGAGIAKGLQALGTRLPKIIQQLAGKPAVEAVAGGVAGGSAGATRELGGSPLQQLGAGLVGGITAGTAASRALRTRGRPTELLGDIGERGIDEPRAFVQVREGLQSEAKKLKEEFEGIKKGGKKIKPGLFDVAKEKGKNAFVNNEQIGELSASFERQAISEVDKDVKDILLSTSKALDNIMKSSKPHLNDNITKALNASQQLEKTFITRGITGVTSTKDDLSRTFKQVNELEGLRRSASRIANSGGSKGFGGGQVLRGIDNFLENATIVGDQKTVGLWEKAITARREFGQKFENPKIIAKAVDSDQTIETIEQLFLGRIVSQKKELAKTYDETLRALQPNQRQKVGFALRQSVLNRMIKSSVQSSDSKEGLSASRLAGHIKNLRIQNKSFWDKFTVKERKELTKLEADLRGLSDVSGLTRTGATLLKIIPSGFLPRVVTPLTELPRTIKLKNIVTVDDLLKLSASRPRPKAKLSTVSPSLVTATTAEQQ